MAAAGIEGRIEADRDVSDAFSSELGLGYNLTY